MKTVGVLALQGAFREHANYLKKASESLGCQLQIIEVRTPATLSICDALVIPGGESTAISLISERTGMLEPLFEYLRSEKPIWGTCAGLIFLSRQVVGAKPGQRLLGGMDIEVQRNAFGRQIDSFETLLDFPQIPKFPVVFIRAPIVSGLNPASPPPSNEDSSIVVSTNSYTNPADIEVLSRIHSTGRIVAVRQGTKLGTSFHPELSGDIRFHKWFLTEFVVGQSGN